MKGETRPIINILDPDKLCPIHYCPECGNIIRPAPQFLTSGELEILRLVGEGLSVSAIAEERHVSIKTVEAHIGSICDKYQIDRGTNDGHRKYNTMVVIARIAIKLGLSHL